MERNFSVGKEGRERTRRRGKDQREWGHFRGERCLVKKRSERAEELIHADSHWGCCIIMTGPCIVCQGGGSCHSSL